MRVVRELSVSDMCSPHILQSGEKCGNWKEIQGVQSRTKII